MIDNKKLKWLIIYSSAMGVATLSVAWFAQPFFKQVNVPLAYFGILWAGLNFSAGFTSLNSHKFNQNKEKGKMLFYLALTMIGALLFVGFNMTLFGLFFIVSIYLLRGIVTPILRHAINENTTSNKRATVLSIRSFIIRISFAIFAPVLGFLADDYSLSISFYVLAILVGFFSILSALQLYKMDKNHNFAS